MNAHPLELVQDKLSGRTLTDSQAALSMIGKRLQIAGVRMVSRRLRTEKGQAMLSMTLEDLEGTLDCMMYPDAYRQWGFNLDLNKPFLLEGVMESETERAEPYFRIEKAANIR